MEFSGSADDPKRRSAYQRRGMYFGLVYLAFMVFPAAELIKSDRSGWITGVSALALAGFSGIYVKLFYTNGLFRHQQSGGSRQGRMLAGALVVLSLTLPLALGTTFVGLVIYAGSATAAVVSPRRVPRAVALLASANLIVMLVLHVDSSTIFTQVLISVVAPLSVMGVRQLVLANVELRTAREDNARLAVSEERLRFARDLHDLLGHSLSLIVLKSELAGRMIDRDVARAAGEVADIESVARQALVEVREAVSGYRRSLDEELVGARAALRAADVAVTLPPSGPPLPAAVESLLGWAVREATTNILRHSRAGSVVMRLDRTGTEATLTITDDGVGPSDAGGHVDVSGCHGLRGLTERMASAGGSVDAGAAASGGFRLRVTVPLDAPSYALAPPADAGTHTVGGSAGAIGTADVGGSAGASGPAGRDAELHGVPAHGRR
ncbi:MAG TPA: sensor histidine kinase [Mycobacteriales bacterium]|nr:sensor histidine kinase [Mycobacteriales bacterium]